MFIKHDPLKRNPASSRARREGVLRRVSGSVNRLYACPQSVSNVDEPNNRMLLLLLWCGGITPVPYHHATGIADGFLLGGGRSRGFGLRVSLDDAVELVLAQVIVH